MSELQESDELITPLRADSDGPAGELNPPQTFTPAPTIGAVELPDAVSYDWFDRYVDHPSRRQQGFECTGFALATAIDHHLRKRAGTSDVAPVSPRMLYEMAQVYDRAAWDEGSTLRGALIGWQRRGVATQELWPYAKDDEDGELHGRITLTRVNDARTRQMPPEAYQKIDPLDLFMMKTALSEHIPLYVGAAIHTGWSRPFKADPDDPMTNITFIEHNEDDTDRGGHAFLIVGYDERGFWVHNSWGSRWGAQGYALLPFEDWQQRGMNVWAINIPRSVDWPTAPAAQDAPSPDTAATGTTSTCTTPIDAGAVEVDPAVVHQMWRHVVPLSDDGRLKADGPFGCDDAMLRNMFYLFKEETEDWERPRLMVFADDGSRDMNTTIEQLIPLRDQLMSEEIYPLFVVWDTPWFPDLDDELTIESGGFSFETNEVRQPVNIGTDDDPVMVDDYSYWQYEYIVPQGMAVMMWRAIQRRAFHAATLADGGLQQLAERIRFRWLDRPFDLHLAAHGAGDFGLSELVSLLEVPVTTCELWSPSTTIRHFENTYGPRLDDGVVEQMTITVLDEASERGDRIGGYHESVLCLASRVLSVAGIDAPSRFHYGPRSETPPPPNGAEEQEAWRKRIARKPARMLGLHEHLSTSAAREHHEQRVHVEVVGGLTHRGMANAPHVIDAAIERIKQAVTPRPTNHFPPPRTPSTPVGSEARLDPLAALEQQWRPAPSPSAISSSSAGARPRQRQRVDPLTAAEHRQR